MNTIDICLDATRMRDMLGAWLPGAPDITALCIVKARRSAIGLRHQCIRIGAEVRIRCWLVAVDARPRSRRHLAQRHAAGEAGKHQYRPAEQSNLHRAAYSAI